MSAKNIKRIENSDKCYQHKFFWRENSWMQDKRCKHEYLDIFPKPMAIYKQFEHGIMIGTIEFTSSDLQRVL